MLDGHSVKELLVPNSSGTYLWWPISAARCIGVFPSTFLMQLWTLCSIRTVMAGRSLSLAVTCSTLFFWLSVDLTNLDPHFESAIRNCWKTDWEISITNSWYSWDYGDLLLRSLLDAFSPEVLGIWDFSDHLWDPLISLGSGKLQFSCLLQHSEQECTKFHPLHGYLPHCRRKEKNANGSVISSKLVQKWFLCLYKLHKLFSYTSCQFYDAVLEKNQ